MASADAAPHLVELGQAEVVGIVNDDRIGVGHVEAVFNETRAEEDVVLSFIEIEHHRLEHGTGHLTVGDADGNIGQEGLEFVFHALDGSDAVIDEEDLAAPPLFTHDGIAERCGRRIRPRRSGPGSGLSAAIR